MERSIPLALAGAAQLLATGNDSCCLIVNVVKGPSIQKSRRAGRDKTLVDPGGSEVEERGGKGVGKRGRYIIILADNCWQGEVD